MYLVTSLSLPGFRALIYADIRCSANRVRTECVCALLTRARGTCVIYIISVCVIYVVSGITGRQQTTGHQTLGPPWQAHRSSSSAAPSRLRVERPDPRAVFVCVCERWGCGKGRRARGHRKRACAFDPRCGPPPRIPLGLAAVRGGFGPVLGRKAAAARPRLEAPVAHKHARSTPSVHNNTSVNPTSYSS